MKNAYETHLAGTLASEDFRLREIPTLDKTVLVVQGKTGGTVTITAKRYGSSDFEPITGGVIDYAAGERSIEIHGAIVELRLVMSVVESYTGLVVQMES